MELLDLHQKLQDTIPTAKLPSLPLSHSNVAASAPPKRKSAFLNTLSRLASPSTNRTSRRSSQARRSANSSAAPFITPSGLPSPSQSPSVEINDPFQSFGNSKDMLSAELPAPSAQATALASYLTAVANLVGVRQTRTWKRFARVRTDDLESVRVERAIKRVRSDLAGYNTVERKDRKEDKEKKEKEVRAVDKENIEPTPPIQAAPKPNEKLVDHKANRDEVELGESKTKEDDASVTSDAGTAATEVTGPSPSTENDTPETVANTSTAVVVDPSILRLSEDEPRTPSATSPKPSPLSSSLTSESSISATSTSAAGAARIGHNQQRSQSADPDKRISRAYLSSAATSASNAESGMSSTSQTETEDDSSTHQSQRRSRRKKRVTNESAGGVNGKDKEKKSGKKVTVEDFEMMRVLGKGCAGKVLLVKNKATEGLYAMKAITKRHVLAHQELQHTLTEQAVLKRMASGTDGKERDPFVVKLWYSFHDKENLFLVMDFHPGGDLATQLAHL